VSRERPRPTAPGSRVPISNRFPSRQLPRRSAWPPSSVDCSRPQQTTLPAANHGEPSGVRRHGKSLISQTHRRERQERGFRRWPRGASCHRWRAGASVLPSIRLTSGELRRFPARFLFRLWLRRGAGLTRFLRPKPVKAGHRDGWRLDFRVFSRKTARAVARDGCERGLAAHSVTSSTADSVSTRCRHRSVRRGE
jgi:hypothetical protein